MDLIDLKEKKFLDRIFNTFTEQVNVIDIGGNKGQYTSNLISKYGEKIKHIDTFEPVPRFYNIIKSKFEKEDLVEIHNKACASSNENSLDFYEVISKKDEAAEGLSSFNHRPVYDLFDHKIIKVDQVKLDDCVSHVKYGLMKIDTEGHELEVLKGSIGLLKKELIDYIQFEFGDCIKERGQDLVDILKLFSKFNYTVYSIDLKGDFKQLNDSNFSEYNKTSWDNYYAINNNVKL